MQATVHLIDQAIAISRQFRLRPHLRDSPSHECSRASSAPSLWMRLLAACIQEALSFAAPGHPSPPARPGSLPHIDEGGSFAFDLPPGHCSIISPPGDEILHRHPRHPAAFAHAATTGARGGMGQQMPYSERSRSWVLVELLLYRYVRSSSLPLPEAFMAFALAQLTRPSDQALNSRN